MEAVVKDGLKLRCKNVKLFLREPLYYVSEFVFPLASEVQASFWRLTEGARRATGVSLPPAAAA